MRVALVLPGQGSQRPGAGSAWRATPAWDEVVPDARAADLLLHADAGALRPTDAAQEATYLASLLAVRSLPDGLDVVVVAGHSLGEVTALVAAGALSAGDGLRVVRERGAAMRAACDAEPGTMAAVLGADPDAVERALPDGAWPANDNAPQHVVVSGRTAAVEAAAPLLKQAGARRVLPLPVGGAFHTPLMAPARERLDAALQAAAWTSPRVPVLSSTRVAPFADPAAELSAQLTARVRWRETALALPDVDVVLECGPGGVLTGLLKRTRPDLRALPVATPEDLEQLA